MKHALNPNHPVTQAMEGQWSTVAALLVARAGGHVVITMDDFSRLQAAGQNIVVQELADGLHLRLVDGATAEQLARREGGLPV